MLLKQNREPKRWGNVSEVPEIPGIFWKRHGHFWQALTRLTKLYEDRAEAYATSDVKVSLQKIASERGHKDVSLLTPTIIAIEALKEIGKFMSYRKLMNAAAGQ